MIHKHHPLALAGDFNMANFRVVPILSSYPNPLLCLPLADHARFHIEVIRTSMFEVGELDCLQKRKRGPDGVVHDSCCMVGFVAFLGVRRLGFARHALAGAAWNTGCR